MSAKVKTTAWSDVLATCPVSEADVPRHLDRIEAEEHAFQLQEVREEQHMTQLCTARRHSRRQEAVACLFPNLRRRGPRPVMTLVVCSK